MAAQGYVLSVKLLASLSEQMLQSLLASPLPSAPISENPTTNVMTDQRIPRTFRLRDCHSGAKHFRHALEASNNILWVGTSRVDEMERLLGLEQGRSTQQENPRIGFGRRPSLPARFVESIWEDEASIDSNCPRVSLRRYRAAIDGLAGNTEH